MNKKSIRFFLGHLLWIEAAFMLPPLIISLVQGEQAAVKAFAITMAIMAACTPFMLFRTKGERKIYARDGIFIVAFSWIVLSFFGALPFVLSGSIPHFIDAWFETVSGFTTTGSTILKDVEALPMGILYWRSFTIWLGGMGVLVFMLIIVPNSGRGKGDMLHILRAESPGPVVGKLAPKLRQSVTILYVIYLGLTVIEIAMLRLGGMPLFDAVNISFSTAGTGGFAITNASMAAYDSYYLQTVAAVFMMLFGVNFSIYNLLLLRQFSDVVKNEEVKTYLGIMVTATLLIALNILPLYGNFRDALHHSYFQVSSIMTTTGLCTTDFNIWPEFSRILLLLLMVVGASAGSTGGGMKVARVLILFKSLKNAVQKVLHPRALRVVKMDGAVVEDNVIRSTSAYVTAYWLVMGASILLVSLDNLSLETTVSSVFACFNNIGPGLDLVGAAGNYSVFSYFSKFVLSLSMLFGRLEIFPMLMLFIPQTWKEK